jgi:hypothetical protein
MARRKPFTGFAAAGVEAPADRATGPVGSEELRGSPPALSPPPTDPRAPMFSWRHEANSPVSRFQTSPDHAPAVLGGGSGDRQIGRDGDPRSAFHLFEPRGVTGPAKDIATGPTFTFILPFHVRSSTTS